MLILPPGPCVTKGASIPLDFKRVGDLVSKLDASCKEITSMRMFQKCNAEQLLYQGYHRALVETTEGSEAARASFLLLLLVLSPFRRR